METYFFSRSIHCNLLRQKNLLNRKGWRCVAFMQFMRLRCVAVDAVKMSFDVLKSSKADTITWKKRLRPRTARHRENTGSDKE